ncbi:glycosyltransferase family protein [Amylibacter sp.]|nr:glycosyltransferase family protein [Amylibacter sp.]
MRVLAIVQARMGSTRRPGKVLEQIHGQTLLEYLLVRLRAVKEFDDIIIATTDHESDDVLYQWAFANNVKCFRGSENNVLSRFYHCASENNAQIIVRITADDPLKDPVVISHAINLLLDHSELDYVSNTIKPTYPEGIDVEVFTFEALQRAFNLAIKKSDQEHVTAYIWNNPEEFRVHNFEAPLDTSYIRLTVDYEEDIEVVRRILHKFIGDPLVSYQQIVNFLNNHPEITEINGGILRNEGYNQSIMRE